MDNSITEKSPAKINLFLKIINRREDNYHNIRTGITSINLCDEIEVNPSDQFNVNYKGPFAPENNKFDDCIIKKIFSFLNITPPNIAFSITKNFPYQAGLGSASSNAATVIKILENLHRIKHLPAEIIQGRHDVICPPITARKLATEWGSKARLRLIDEAGHSTFESGIAHALLAALEECR